MSGGIAPPKISSVESFPDVLYLVVLREAVAVTGDSLFARAVKWRPRGASMAGMRPLRKEVMSISANIAR